MISVDRVGVQAGVQSLIKEVSFEAKTGEVTAIIGPNGAGKSTLLSAISGTQKFTGEIAYGGRSVRSFSPPELASIRAVMGQSFGMAFSFKVAEVVALGAVNKSHSINLRAVVQEVLAEVDMLSRADQVYHHLSGGEKQRTQLARVLCQLRVQQISGRPRYLFLDEPTASLDIRHQTETLTLARDFAKRGNVVISVLHDLNQALKYADQVILLSSGSLVTAGLADVVLIPEVLEPIYGVKLTVAHVDGANHLIY